MAWFRPAGRVLFGSRRMAGLPKEPKKAWPCILRYFGGGRGREAFGLFGFLAFWLFGFLAFWLWALGLV
ncbi:hypothetical protein [Stutzerimonas stutzeri]|uniref:hypothetical protein n=1 Tax=Stutzerimonas stutzeri TaxID=316 RepID=UPI00210CE92D|nr:hypothetical protein [Stutzerimonas stutzeri]MCQ4259578.1 hypothetical protein [Stutzerimonas stutzeri]